MKPTTILKLLASVLGAGALLSAHAATTLTVYTALEADQIKAYQAEFEKSQKRLGELEAESFELGRQVYAERPAALTRRIMSYWKSA